MNALFPLSNFVIEQRLIPSQTMEILKSHGINLSTTQISQLETHRKEELIKNERWEFDTWGLCVLFEDLASSEAIHPNEFVKAARSAITLFYETRDIVNPVIGDQEIAELIVSEIIQKQGCVEHLDSFELAASFHLKQPTLAEEIMQSETNSAYCWNNEDWEYDEFAPGWNGESWEKSYE